MPSIVMGDQTKVQLYSFYTQNYFIPKRLYNPLLLTGEENNPTNERSESGRFDQSGGSGSSGGGGGRRSDVPPTGGGSGLLQSVEQAGSSLLRAAMSLVPTIRFVPWQPGGRKPPANRRSGGGDTRWQRTQGRNSVPDTGRDGEWKPLVI